MVPQMAMFLIMDVGVGGTEVTCHPHFSKTRKRCSFSCNLAALPESFKDASKIYASSEFKGSKIQNFPVGACLRAPLAPLILEVFNNLVYLSRKKLTLISYYPSLPVPLLDFHSFTFLPFALLLTMPCYSHNPHCATSL